MIKDIIGLFLILTSILDAIKYYWSAANIKKLGTAKGRSRKFINAALLNGIVRLLYGIAKLDSFLITSSILALITITYNFYIIYMYYPYKYRNLLNFKRPPIWIYLVNSLIPNKYRKRL